MKKTCNIHGELPEEQIYKRIVKANTIRTECILCRQEKTGVQRKGNRVFKVPRTKPIVTKTCKKHGVLVPEHIYVYRRLAPLYRYECKICRNISANKQRAKSNHKVLKKILKKKSIVHLSDSYVKDRLAYYGYAREDMSKGLVECKRAMLYLVRAVRDRLNGAKKRSATDQS